MTDIYRAGFIVAAIIGGAVAVYCYGSYASWELDGIVLLVVTGALSGIAYWLVVMNDYLGLKR